MKKLITLSIAVAIVLTLSACGGNKENAGGNSNASGNENASAATELKIVASNWKFDQAEYHVKKGEPVKLTVESKEGAHGLEIPSLNINLGINQSKVVTFDKAGTYDIQCSIPCGTGHTNMKAKLVVE
jgi:cytochrome c oxidase subunit 2